MVFIASRWLAFLLLLYVFLLHLASLYLFTRGFLLTRLSLSDISSNTSRTLPATHSRAILLIIDALRFDFVSPSPPSPSSPYHHGILTLPRQLTSENPMNSFLFDTYADPPTTTLQRIKGVTTGSLPTFVDIGSNFAGSEIAEDSLLLQMTNAGRKVAFMGDDTWTAVYPTSFVPNMSFPYDSFNVEDLHSVDEGVIRHLFPLLEPGETSSWDMLIGHFLGVDHVAHRLGPAHPTMSAKLKQMNEVLTRVVELLDDDTLLIVIGDHGMDRKGDHGGDGEHETSAATWIFSKTIPLSSGDCELPSQLVPNATFPQATMPHRWIQQIDLVPTLSLLLGLPIPFNNLGTVIPELFCTRNAARLERALRLNADQIKNYLYAYRSSPSGGELDSVWKNIQLSWISTLSSEMDAIPLALYNFTRLALTSCRTLWAQFNVLLMYTGLFTLVVVNLAVCGLFSYLWHGPKYWEVNGWDFLRKSAFASILSSISAVVLVKVSGISSSLGLLESSLAGATIGSSLTLLACTVPKLSFSLENPTVPLILVLHSLIFLSNSFTFWEDRILNFFLVTSLIPFALRAFKTVDTLKIDVQIRHRILLFSLVFAICVKIVGSSTICREEQHPYCHVTFYASSSLPAPPSLVLLVSVPASTVFPSVVRRFLALSRSDKGVASFFLEVGLRTSLLAGNIYWTLEWLESSGILGNQWATALRTTRTLVARTAMIAISVAGGVLWWYSSLCLDVSRNKGQSGQTRVQIIGFANSYGSSFLLFVLIFFSLLFFVTQLTGQLTLMLSMISLLAFLEIIDSVRDVESIRDSGTSAGLGDVSKPNFVEILPVALLGLHTFYSTGHQSTLPSIQWKTAFLFTPTLSYPTSPLLVWMNFFGPQLFFAVAVPLLAVWKVAPVDISAPKKSESPGFPRFSVNSRVLVHVLRASLGLSVYYSTLLLSSAASSAWLRRHLMVWKVFAPRFMAAGGAVLAVDLGLLIGVTLGIGPVLRKVREKFQGFA